MVKQYPAFYGSCSWHLSTASASHSCSYESKVTLFPDFEFIPGRTIMLVKLTSKNRLTLPKAITATVEATDTST